MSASEATRFLTTVEADNALAERLNALGKDTTAIHAAVRAAGFDCTPDEIKDAFIATHGAKLTSEQLDAIAGGIDDTTWIAIGVTSGVQIAATAAAAF